MSDCGGKTVFCDQVARARQFMRLSPVILLTTCCVALSACGEAAKAKTDVTLRSAPENDGVIVARIPQDSAVTVSKCAHGWCQVSWRGQRGYALAKYFSLAGSAADADLDSDQRMQDDEEGADD